MDAVPHERQCTACAGACCCTSASTTRTPPTSFEEALQSDPKNAQAFLGLALVSADGFDNKAVAEVRKALEFDPKLVEAHELLANLELEDSDPKSATEEADEALKISPEALDAMAIHAAIEVLADRSPDAWLAKVQAVNPTYGEAYAIVAHHLMLNRRYDESVAYYRKAIEADPRLWSARSELGINLMRLGQEDEPLQQLRDVLRQWLSQRGHRKQPAPAR